MALRAPRVNDRRVDQETGERRRFSSRILPRYARRSPRVTDVLPVLYLRGLSSGDFAPALRELLGEDASGLSASSISRLTVAWREEHRAFKCRRLDFVRYAYLFADGVHVSVRLGEDKRLCHSPRRSRFLRRLGTRRPSSRQIRWTRLRLTLLPSSSRRAWARR